eukprot:CAMPEP_0194122296 /NCGR_PEP_ID=MMETSP0150-20130528/50088_1 /TAXON_ID=122233 /ORGANISM="Chaetoceros debilis, Strain MM31A-1" /LENGTH=38 /DNA_ID= /DNA_START= /DNA_END= /DNA_ORIENTATION=
MSEEWSIDKVIKDNGDGSIEFDFEQDKDRDNPTTDDNV